MLDKLYISNLDEICNSVEPANPTEFCLWLNGKIEQFKKQPAFLPYEYNFPNHSKNMVKLSAKQSGEALEAFVNDVRIVV